MTTFYFNDGKDKRMAKKKAPTTKERLKSLEKRFTRFEKTTTDQLQQLSDRVAALLRKTSKAEPIGE